MEISAQIGELNFLDIAQQVTPVDGADVYFYILNNENINVRKTVVGDFDTWIVIYNHYDDASLILTGAAPTSNAERYTLVQKLDNVVKSVVEIPEVAPQE